LGLKNKCEGFRQIDSQWLKPYKFSLFDGSAIFIDCKWISEQT